MSINVIHIRDANFDDPSHVYIGRKHKGKVGSPLGNPEPLRNETDRLANLGRYRKWLWEHATPNSPQLAEIQRLHQLHDKYGQIFLVCFCAPKACHGDVIKSAMEWGGYHPNVSTTNESDRSRNQIQP